MFFNRPFRMSEALPSEAQHFLASLLRELPDNVRGALRDLYMTGASVEAICARWNLSIDEFAETRQAIRSRFAERPNSLQRKPVASAHTQTCFDVSHSA